MSKATETALNHIITKLDVIEQLSDDIKQHAMIPDVFFKEKLATLKGLPLHTFYYLPYRVWAKIARKYQANLDLMYANCTEYSKYSGKDFYYEPLENWYADFGIWAKQNGFYWY